MSDTPLFEQASIDFGALIVELGHESETLLALTEETVSLDLVLRLNRQLRRIVVTTRRLAEASERMQKAFMGSSA